MLKQYLQKDYLWGRIKSFRLQIKNLSLFLLATVLSTFVQILINPFLAANLSPEDYAKIGYFTSFNSLVLYLISFSFISYYARNYYKISEDQRHKVLNTLLVSQLTLGSLVMIIVLVGFYIYMRIAKVSFPFYPFALLCFVPIFFNCFYSFLLVDKRMKRQAGSFFKITVTYSVLGSLLALFFVVLLKQGATGRFWSMLIPMIIMGVYGFFKLLTRFEFDKSVMLDAISFGWPISLSSILYYFLSGVDRAMLVNLNDTNTFGFYNVALQIASYLSVFYTAIVQTFEPDIYKTIAENNEKKLIKLVAGIILLNAIPTLLFIVLAHPVVSILTYGRYTDSTTFARIIAFKNIPMACCFLVSNVIIGYGYPKVELVNRAVGAFLSVLMFRFLIERFGFYGAAWGQSFAYILMTVISILFVVYKVLARRRLYA